MLIPSQVVRQLTEQFHQNIAVDDFDTDVSVQCGSNQTT
jgi:hypothetical protein